MTARPGLEHEANAQLRIGSISSDCLVVLLIGLGYMGEERQLPHPLIRQGRFKARAVFQAAICRSALGWLPPSCRTIPSP